MPRTLFRKDLNYNKGLGGTTRGFTSSDVFIHREEAALDAKLILEGMWLTQ